MGRQVVLDTSAFVAVIKDEPGAENVRRIMREASGEIRIHAVNAIEISYYLIRFGLPPFVAFELVSPEGFAVIEELEQSVWQRSAVLKAENRDLSLGDSVAIAFAEEIGADLVTGDRQFQNVATSARIVMFR